MPKHQIQIQINYNTKTESQIPEEVISAEIEREKDFIDISFIDPKSKNKTKITILKCMLNEVMDKKSRQY